jgi:sodium-dependent phosphate cotransporter
VFTVHYGFNPTISSFSSNQAILTAGLLAAFATDSNLELTVQMAFCHMFFNLFGILLFYPLPFLRIPLKLAVIFGEKVVKYR